MSTGVYRFKRDLNTYEVYVRATGKLLGSVEKSEERYNLRRPLVRRHHRSRP